MGKPRQKRKRTNRAIRQRLDAIEHILAAREASELPTPAEQRAAADCIREGLREKLRIASEKGTRTTGPEAEVILTGTALELAERFRTMAEVHEAEARRKREEDRDAYWAGVRRRWEIIAGVQEQSEEVAEKNIPMAPAETVERKASPSDIASAFSLANDAGSDYQTPDSFFDVRGESESEIRREAVRRYGSGQ